MTATPAVSSPQTEPDPDGGQPATAQEPLRKSKSPKKDSADTVTPMMAQYHAIKRGHPDCLLFYRMGDFYEMFFEDAELVSKPFTPERLLSAIDRARGVERA